jgi:hypothetical protein
VGQVVFSSFPGFNSKNGKIIISDFVAIPTESWMDKTIKQLIEKKWFPPSRPVGMPLNLTSYFLTNPEY